MLGHVIPFIHLSWDWIMDRPLLSSKLFIHQVSYSFDSFGYVRHFAHLSWDWIIDRPLLSSKLFIHHASSSLDWTDALCPRKKKGKRTSVLQKQLTYVPLKSLSSTVFSEEARSSNAGAHSFNTETSDAAEIVKQIKTSKK